MAMPKRIDPDDYYAQLEDYQRPHLLRMREISREIAPEASEELRWSTPAYILDSMLWLLQAFKHHATLRLPLRIVSDHAALIEAAGYEPLRGAIKLPYEKELPEDVLRTLMQARLAEHAETGIKWS